MAELANSGVHAERIPGAQLYVLSGNVDGLVYIKTRSEGKAFFGLGADFLKCLLGNGGTGLSEKEKAYILWRLSEDEGPEVEAPENFKRHRSAIYRRLLLLARKDER